MQIPPMLRAVFLRDPDQRRLYWLRYRAPLSQAHRMVVTQFLFPKVDNLAPEERTIIRTLTNLYRGTDIEVRT